MKIRDLKRSSKSVWEYTINGIHVYVIHSTHGFFWTLDTLSVSFTSVENVDETKRWFSSFQEAARGVVDFVNVSVSLRVKGILTLGVGDVDA